MVRLMMRFHADKNTENKMATIGSALYSLFRLRSISSGCCNVDCDKQNEMLTW